MTLLCATAAQLENQVWDQNESESEREVSQPLTEGENGLPETPLSFLVVLDLRSVFEGFFNV